MSKEFLYAPKGFMGLGRVPEWQGQTPGTRKTVIQPWGAFPLNHLQHFHTSTWIGCNKHVGFPSPAHTWNKLSIVILCVFTRNGINGPKFVRSDWHGKRSIVGINLQENIIVMPAHAHNFLLDI